MIVRAGMSLALCAMLTASVLAQGAPKQGAPQRGGAKPMPPQGQVGQGFRGGPRGPMGDVEVLQGNNLGEAVLRERLTEGFDANANGQLDREECDRAIAAIRDRQALAARGVQPVLTEQDVVQMFDADGNGQLSVPEYASACRSMDMVLGEGASQRIAQQGQRQGGQQGQGVQGQGVQGQGGQGQGGGRGGPKGIGGRGGGGGGGGGGSGGRGR